MRKYLVAAVAAVLLASAATPSFALMCSTSCYGGTCFTNCY